MHATAGGVQLWHRKSTTAPSVFPKVVVCAKTVDHSGVLLFAPGWYSRTSLLPPLPSSASAVPFPLDEQLIHGRPASGHIFLLHGNANRLRRAVCYTTSAMGSIYRPGLSGGGLLASMGALSTLLGVNMSSGLPRRYIRRKFCILPDLATSRITYC